jgi:hypothetical protein
VSPDGREKEKKPNVAKVCVNEDSDAMTLTMSKATEAEFASLDELIAEIKLVFQVPSGKVNIRG